MARLGMPVGHTTILRNVKQSARGHGGPASVRVAGIDDWAWKKGMNYGTLIVDPERPQVMKLLADRSAVSTADWLKGHPEIEVVSRDRAGLYAVGVRQGAPQARQIADRFHLLQNFREAVERQLGRFGAPIRERPSSGADDDSSPTVNSDPGQRGRSEGAEQRQRARRSLRADRQALFDQIRALYDAGRTIREIAQELDIWLADARQSGIRAMQRFAITIRHDIGAVRNAVMEPRSNGQTEGQINRLKTLKPSKHGRAGVELLRARMMPFMRATCTESEAEPN